MDDPSDSTIPDSLNAPMNNFYHEHDPPSPCFPPDFDYFGDDGAPCDEVRPSDQSHIDISQDQRTQRPSSQGWPSEYLRMEPDGIDDVCNKKGEGGVSCGCTSCFFTEFMEEDIQEDARSGSLETPIHSLGATIETTMALPIRAQAENMPQNWNRPIEAFSTHSIPQSSNLLSSSSMECSLNENFEKPRKRRRAKAASPVESIQTPEQLLEMMENALRSNPTLRTPALMRKIQALFNVKNEPSSKTTESKQTHNPNRSGSAFTKGEGSSKVELNTLNTISLPAHQPRTAVGTTRNPPSPGNLPSGCQAVSAGPFQTSRGTSTIYHCTYPKCKSNWTGRCAKSDWKRHEVSVHWNNPRWMCKQCSSSHALPQGGLACNFCLAVFSHAEAINQHTPQCDDAWHGGKTFSRKDKLRDHLRDHHNVQDVEEYQLSWKYKVEGDWPRQCGFCGIALNDWNSRANHVGDEFSNGAKISDWRIPFVPKSTDRKLDDFGQHADSNDDDDDDDIDHDFHNSMGGRIRATWTPQHIAPRPAGASPAGASEMGWNYESNSRNSARFDDRDQSAQGDDYESGAASTCTLQPKAVAASKIPGSLIESCAPECGVSHGDFQSSKKTSLEVMGSLTSSVPKQQQQESSEEGVTSKELIGIKEKPQEGVSQCGTQGLEQNSQSFSTSQLPEGGSNLESASAAALMKSSAPKGSPTYHLASHGSWTSCDTDRLRYLYLENTEEPRSLLLDTAAKVHMLSPPRETQISAAKVAHRISDVWRANSTSSVNSSTLEEVASSISSAGTSIATSISIPLWRPPPLFTPLFTLPAFSFGYDLPCEFFFLGCNLRFDPAHLETWISHSASHFVNVPLPSIAVCTFCDEATFRSHGDATINWRERMLHVSEHFEDLTPCEDMRPDFWVIEHMARYGLISPEDHEFSLQGTERPYCDNLYPLDYETPEMLNKKERDSRERYDMRKEDRQRKKDAKKGKTTNTPLSFHRSNASYNPHGRTPNLKWKNERAFQQRPNLREEMRNTWKAEREDKRTHKTEKDHCLECHLFGKCTERAEKAHCLDCQIFALLHQTQDTVKRMSLEELPERESCSIFEFETPILDLQEEKSSTRTTGMVSSNSRISKASNPSFLSSFDQPRPRSPKAMATNDEFGQLEVRPLPEQIVTKTPVSESNVVVKPVLQSLISRFCDSVAAPTVSVPRWTSGASRESLLDFAESSVDSQSSYDTHDTRSSREKRYYASSGSSILYYTSSQSSMDYYGGSQSKIVEERKERKYRAPDADHKNITSWTRGDVEVIDHRRRVYDPQEPRSSVATSTDHGESRRR